MKKVTKIILERLCEYIYPGDLKSNFFVEIFKKFVDLHFDSKNSKILKI